MSKLPTLVFAVLVMAVAASRARALDVHLGLPSLRLSGPLAAPASAELAPRLSLVNVAALSAASVASAALPAPDATRAGVDRRLQRKRGGPGYGLAAALGVTIGGLVLAVQTRPKESYGVCYDDPQKEKKFLYIATGFMAAGLVVSSGMLVWLTRMRRAHPDVRPTGRTRGLQALVGFVSASVTATILMSNTIGCLSS